MLVARQKVRPGDLDTALFSHVFNQPFQWKCFTSPVGRWGEWPATGEKLSVRPASRQSPCVSGIQPITFRQPIAGSQSRLPITFIGSQTLEANQTLVANHAQPITVIKSRTANHCHQINRSQSKDDNHYLFPHFMVKTHSFIQIICTLYFSII